MRVKFFQEGGAVDNAGSQDPMAQIVQMAAQALQNNDPNLAMQVCQALVELAQQAMQQQQQEVPESGTPETGNEEGEPVYRIGGRLVRRIRK